MFGSRYYRGKFIYENNGKLFLFEFNVGRNEAYILSIDENNDVDIRLRSLFNNPIRDNEVLIPLSIYLMNNGYTDNDFRNPFTRTKKILDELKEKNKEKVLTKKK